DTDTDTNTTYSAGNDLDLTGTTFDLESTLDIVSTINLAGTGTINGLDAIDLTTESTLESALDIAGDVSGTGLGSVTIGADKVLESHLKAVDTASDEECLTYETTTGDFEWQACDTVVDTDDQNLFETFAVLGQSDVLADSPTDALTMAAGSNVTITTNAGTDTITIAATDTNTTYGAGNDLDLNGTTFELESTLDIVSTINLAGAGTLNGLDAIDATGETTLEAALDIGGDISGTGLTAVTIGADKVLESHLKAVDTAADEECLTFETTTGDFEWQACSGASGTQNLFETFAVSGQSNVVADSTTDTMTLVAGTNVSITTNASTDTITIASTDTNTTYSAGSDLDLDGTTFALEDTLDIVSTINLAGTGTLNGLDAIDATTETTLEGALDIGGDISGTGLSSVTIGADKVLESHLKAVDAAGDEECLTYETTTGDFEWEACLESGTTLFTATGTSGDAQTIGVGDTLTIAAGSGITTTGSATDTITIAATLGASITNGEIDANTIDWDRITNTSSLDADTSIAAGAGEDLTFAKTFTDATSENGLVLNFTALDTSAGTTAQYGMYLDNLASSEGVDAALVIDNSDSDDAVVAGIKFIDAGGGFTAVIDNAGTLISGAELNRLDGKDADLVDSNDAVATAITGTG
ncbi:MAG: hypothetical protein WD972_03305, partial [Candidatus Andersenbacteria bacterium]